jgi:hypothetical protein
MVIQKMLATASGPMHALFDMYKVDFRGSAMWLGSVQSYSVALFEIELIAARAPGDYAIVNRQTGDRTALSFGLSVDGNHNHVNPVTARMPRWRTTASSNLPRCKLTPILSPT